MIVRFGHLQEQDKGGQDHLIRLGDSALADLIPTPITHTHHTPITDLQDADSILQPCTKSAQSFQWCSTSAISSQLALNFIFPLDHSYSPDRLLQAAGS